MADKITFFRSYYEAVKKLEPEDFKDVLMTLFEYAFEDKEPSDMSATAEMFWTLVKPTAEISIKRSRAGKEGGKRTQAKLKQIRSKPQANPKQTSSKPQAKQSRHKYGEYGHVLLKDEQYRKLVNEFGEPLLTSAIQILDEYCQSSGKSYKDYNLVLRKWPMDEAKKKQMNNGGDFFMRLANGEEHL